MRKPSTQAMPHWPCVQVACPLGTEGQLLQSEPQFAGFVLSTHTPPQACQPEEHVRRQEKSLAQLAVPCGSAQGMHALLQAILPASHVKPQTLFWHAEVEPAGVGHGSQALPQCVGSESAKHSLPQA